MDFGHWGDPNKGSNKGNDVAATGPVTDSANQQQTEQLQASSNSASVDGSEMMHQFEHPGIYCDVCSSTINGFRYKCLQCPDYDLCTSCERRGHHAGHIMMRIAFPEQAPDAISRYFERQAGNDMSSGEDDHGAQEPEGQEPRNGRPGKGKKHYRKKHQKKWRKSDSDSSDEDSGAGGAEAIPRVGFPNAMGKKEMKKYAKQMKKMLYMQKKAEKKGDGGKDGEKGAKRQGPG